jgi:hypothetical protein
MRNEIEVLPADADLAEESVIIDSRDSRIHRDRLLGWTITETIGIAVVNTRAISKLNKNVVIGE